MNSDSPAPQRARQVHGERGHSGGGAALGGRRRTVGGRGRQSLDPPAAPGHTQLSNREQPHGADQHGEQRESRAQPAALVFDGQRAAEGRQGEQQQGAGGQPQRHRVPGRLGRGQPLGADQVAGQGRHLCRGGRVAQPVLPRAGRPQLAGHGGQADRANQRPEAGQHGEQQGQRCAQLGQRSLGQQLMRGMQQVGAVRAQPPDRAQRRGQAAAQREPGRWQAGAQHLRVFAGQGHDGRPPHQY